MAGIDVRFDYADLKDMVVDEKAAVHYVNKDIPTFAFEIDFSLGSGTIVDGWLFDEKKVTQYYLLCWIWAEKTQGFKSDDITQVDLVIVNRYSILKMLERFNIDHGRASKIASTIRLNGASGIHYRSPLRPFYFFYSPQLAERPVNMIINKSKLIELSAGRHIVRKN